MPHKCMKCGKIYDSESLALTNGCECGARLFLFLADPNKAPEIKNAHEVEETILTRFANQTSKPLSLDVENVKILQDGIFEMDLRSLAENPITVKDDKGIYYIQLPVFKKKQ
ncbi:MAG: Zn-ribbon containing protein [Candidatus Micrarchaeota archaeon]